MICLWLPARRLVQVHSTRRMTAPHDHALRIHARIAGLDGSFCVSNNLFMNFFFSSRRRHTRFKCDWSSDVCSSDLAHHLSLDPEVRFQIQREMVSATGPSTKTDRMATIGTRSLESCLTTSLGSGDRKSVV